MKRIIEVAQEDMRDIRAAVTESFSSQQRFRLLAALDNPHVCEPPSSIAERYDRLVEAAREVVANRYNRSLRLPECIEALEALLPKNEPRAGRTSRQLRPGDSMTSARSLRRVAEALQQRDDEWHDFDPDGCSINTGTAARIAAEALLGDELVELVAKFDHDRDCKCGEWDRHSEPVKEENRKPARALVAALRSHVLEAK